MRLFTAITIPKEISESRPYRELIVDLSKLLITLHTPQKLHITLAFLDQFDETNIPRLIDLLKTTQQKKFPITLSGVGVFDSIKQPHVIFVGTSNPPELALLDEQIRKVLEANAFFFDPKPFRPHVTLARIKEIHWHEYKNRKRFTKDEQKFLQVLIKKYEFTDFGSFTIDHFSLIESSLGELGHIYTTLSRFELQK